MRGGVGKNGRLGVSDGTGSGTSGSAAAKGDRLKARSRRGKAMVCMRWMGWVEMGLLSLLTGLPANSAPTAKKIGVRFDPVGMRFIASPFLSDTAHPFSVALRRMKRVLTRQRIEDSRARWCEKRGGIGRVLDNRNGWGKAPTARGTECSGENTRWTRPAEPEGGRAQAVLSASTMESNRLSVAKPEGRHECEARGKNAEGSDAFWTTGTVGARPRQRGERWSQSTVRE